MEMAQKVLALPMGMLREYLNQKILDNPMAELDQPVIRARMVQREDESDPSDDAFARSKIGRRAWAGSTAPVNTVDATEEMLPSYLKKQLHQFPARFLARYERICGWVIDSLDRRGYLDESVDLLASAFGVPVEDVLQALYAIQTLTPTGVGARSLEECLTLQLAERRTFNQYTLAIIRRHLPLLAENNIAAIAEALEIGEAEAARYCETIRQMNPIPGNGFPSQREADEYRSPEVFVESASGEDFSLSYNDDFAPHISANPEYLALMHTTDDSALRSYLEGHYRQINELQRELRERERLLLRLVRFIAERQRAYLLGRQPAPAPLSVHEIADGLEWSESIVSLGIRDKYISCFGRLLPLRRLLSTQVGKNIPVSREMLRLYITRIIAAEDKPLSDKDIRGALKAMNVSVPLEEVTACREAFGIPDAAAR